MGKFFKYECRRYDQDPTKTWLIVNDTKTGEIDRILIDLPYPRNHDFWDRDGGDSWVIKKLTGIYNAAKMKREING